MAALCGTVAVRGAAGRSLTGPGRLTTDDSRAGDVACRLSIWGASRHGKEVLRPPSRSTRRGGTRLARQWPGASAPALPRWAGLAVRGHRHAKRSRSSHGREARGNPVGGAADRRPRFVSDGDEHVNSPRAVHHANYMAQTIDKVAQDSREPRPAAPPCAWCTTVTSRASLREPGVETVRRAQQSGRIEPLIACRGPISCARGTGSILRVCRWSRSCS